MRAITARKVTKRFKIYNRPRDRVFEMLGARGKSRLVTALKDVSFAVEPGECFGIIGENGSGKTTLLRLLAGISRPSRGTVHVEGRISALLELNSGFHPEFTGRENLRLNAAIIGLSAGETRERETEIIAFAGLADFIDLPVRTYSAGMYLRLGFAIATSVNPDVLLIDEALAVGDESFRGKCTERIQQFKKAGKTVVIVSHDLAMVRSLCHRALLLKQGRVLAEAAAAEAIDSYLDLIYESAAARLDGETGELDPARPHKGTGEVEITAVRMLNAAGRMSTVFRTGEPFSIEFDYTARSEVQNPLFGVNIFRIDGVLAISTNQECSRYSAETLPSALRTEAIPDSLPAGKSGTVGFTVPANPLMNGAYELGVNLFRGRSGAHIPVDEVLGAVRFQVVSGGFLDRGLMLCPGEWVLK